MKQGMNYGAGYEAGREAECKEITTSFSLQTRLLPSSNCVSLHEMPSRHTSSSSSAYDRRDAFTTARSSAAMAHLVALRGINNEYQHLSEYQHLRTTARHSSYIHYNSRDRNGEVGGNYVALPVTLSSEGSDVTSTTASISDTSVQLSSKVGI